MGVFKVKVGRRQGGLGKDKVVGVEGYSLVHGAGEIIHYYKDSLEIFEA
jgi:hypothetical protein